MLNSIGKISSLLFVLALYSQTLLAQSNPTPFDLSLGSYQLNEWNSDQIAGTYPANMIFHITNLAGSDPNLDVEMTGDYSGPYNLTSRSRINGLGADGFSFTNTGSTDWDGYMGAAVLALDTRGRQNIEVNWTGRTIAVQLRTFGIQMQYRIGTVGAFNDVLGQLYVVNANGHTQSFTATLPANANDHEVVQIRWKYHHIPTGVTGARPQLAVDDIVVNSQPIPGSLVPEPHILSISDYSFIEWSNANAAGTYPANMMFYVTGSTDPGLDVPTTGFYSDVYNRTSGARINGQGELGFSFINTGSGTLGASVLALDTRGRSDIEVTWTGRTIIRNERLYGLQLQYRIGNKAEWTNIAGQLYEANVNGHSQVFGPFRLPVETEDKALVELRWKYHHIPTGVTGTRPMLGVDDITVSSSSLFGEPTRLEIIDVTPSSPLVNIPFALTVRAIDDSGDSKRVAGDVEVQLSLHTGNGSLSGTLTATIPNGMSQVTFNNVIYDRTGFARVRAEVASGQALQTTTQHFTLQQGPNHIETLDFDPRGYANKTHSPFTIRAVYENNGTMSLIEDYSGYNAEITLVNGPGNVSGNTTVIFNNGVATFNNLVFDAPGTYELIISADGINNKIQAFAIINPEPTYTELVVPKYMKGDGDFNNPNQMRFPVYALIEVNNLHPNTKYRYVSGARNTSYVTNTPETDDGAGNNIHFNETTGEYRYTSAKSKFLVDGEDFSTFITGPNETSKRVWINMVPTRNAAFNEGVDVYFIFSLGTDNGVVLDRYRFQNTMKSLTFGTGATRATGIYDENSWLAPGTFMALYSTEQDAEAQVKRPLSVALVNDAGSNLQNCCDNQGNPFPNEGPIWYANLERVNQSWATYIPNREHIGNDFSPIGIMAMEHIDGSGNLARSWTDADGVWRGVNTNNPSGGIFEPIKFHTPQLELISPVAMEEICNGRVPFEIRWRHQAVAAVNISAEITRGNNIESIVIASNYPASRGVYHWSILRNRFIDADVKIIISSVEHSYLTDEATGLIIKDLPFVANQTRSTVICENETITLTVSVTGSPFAYQWLKDGVEIEGANSDSYTVRNAKFLNSGVYTCNLIEIDAVCPIEASEEIALYVARETKIAREPRNSAVVPGGTARFYFDAHANGLPPSYQLKIQWYRGDINNPEKLENNAQFFGVNSNLLTVSNVDDAILNNLNTYWAEVEGLCGNLIRTQTVSIIEAGVTITEQPMSAELCEGDDLVLSVSATSNSSISYQWYLDGRVIQNTTTVEGARTNQLRISNISSLNAGEYYVELTSESDNFSLFSDIVLITVNDLPTYLLQPESDKTVEVGKSFTLSILADNASTYQWYKGGQAIANATESNYEVTSATMEDVGTYYCHAINSCGEVPSETSTVVVTTGQFSSVENGSEANGVILFNTTPNPVAGLAKVQFSLPISKTVELNLVDNTGANVATIANSFFATGINSIDFDFGKLNIANGVYFMVLNVDNAILSVKVVIER